MATKEEEEKRVDVEEQSEGESVKEKGESEKGEEKSQKGERGSEKGEDNAPEKEEDAPEEKEKTPEEQIEALTEEVEKLKDARLRLVAEFDNYKRRTSREHINLISTANEDLIKTLLPVLENFERAVHQTDALKDPKGFKKGIEMIYNQFFEELKKAGVTEESPDGEEFDSDKHEAMMQVASKDHAENKIVQVLQKGYRLGEKVIQFAKVSVSKG